MTKLFLLLFCVVATLFAANSLDSHPQQLQDMIRKGISFMEKNGKKYISVITLNQSINLQKYMHNILRNSSAWFRVQSTDNIQALQTLNQDSFLLVDFANQLTEPNIHHAYLPFIIQKPLWKCLMVVINSSESSETIHGFKTAVNNLNENVGFYVLDDGHWFEIFNVKNTDRSLARKLTVNARLEVVRKGWDLEGLTITDISSDFMPFSGSSNCDSNGMNCEIVTGIIPSIFKVLQERINVTVKHIYEPSADWGMTPKSGKRVYQQ